MGRFLSGLILVMTIVILRTAIPTMELFGNVSQTTIPGCGTIGTNATSNSTDNFNSCSQASSGTFLKFVFAVVVPHISGAPLLFNVFYFLIAQAALIGGVILMVQSFVPATAQ